eukprot:TRINITY_DN55068_c0_g1_i1.p1 TRINITY_DN55068_c0_g1~~TRINITY_DN55068_c0_g1_i1.p1  ORF type:complete len:704 (+),score=228.03 TRINITY_DN55068_c0_g1_i1:149-2260(+)
MAAPAQSAAAHAHAVRIGNIGIDPVQVANIVKNEELARGLVALLDEVKVHTCDKSQGNLFYTVAAKAPAEHRSLLARYIADKKIATAQQCDAAIKFVTSQTGAAFDLAALEKAAGVGVTVSAETITAEVAKALAAKKDQVTKERYQFNLGRLLGELRRIEALRWASPEQCKAELERQVEAMLGPRTAEDEAAAAPAKGGKKAAATGSPRRAAGAAAGAAAVEQSATGSGTPEQQKALVDECLGIPGEGRPLVLLKDIPSMVGKEGVVVRGWVHNYRKQSAKLGFVGLRDGTGSLLQCVFSGHTPELVRECTIGLRGTIHAEPKAVKARGQMPFEMRVSDWVLIGPSDPEIENVINQASDVDVRLNQRHIHLRWTGPAAVQRVRTCALQAFRQHFWSVNCSETQPPTLVQTQCEGGSTLFGFDYYGEQAYLTQSSQLYLETAIPFMGDCFCILPSYRAEKSKTKRHLSEFCHIEAEYPFIRFADLLQRIEHMVIDVTTRLMDLCGEEIRFLNPTPLEGWVDDGTDSWKQRYIPKKGFRLLPHQEAIKFCRENGIYKDEETQTHFEMDDDIPDAPERAMVAKFGEPIFMIKFPATIKSFYMKRCEAEDERHLTESVDLLMPGVGEIVGGSMRIHDFKELMEGYSRENLKPEPYYWFTDQRRFGTTPHGGFGLGLERFLLWLCGGDHCQHVRDTCLYPRLMGRCQP